MACCICGKNVAGLPVMRDNETGLECCESCGLRLGGPSGFVEYVDSLQKKNTQMQSNPLPSASSLPLPGESSVSSQHGSIWNFLVVWGMGAGIGIGGLCLVALLIFGFFAPDDVADRSFLITNAVVGTVALGVGLTCLRHYRRMKKGDDLKI